MEVIEMPNLIDLLNAETDLGIDLLVSQTVTQIKFMQSEEEGFENFSLESNGLKWEGQFVLPGSRQTKLTPTLMKLRDKNPNFPEQIDDAFTNCGFIIVSAQQV